MKRLFLLILLLFSTNSLAATGTSVTVGDVTFNFTCGGGDCTHGLYADNYSPWVLDTGSGVVITSMTPAYDGGSYGWEVNPIPDSTHGYDDSCYDGGFDSSLVPSLPYTAHAGDSIVKTTPSRVVEPDPGSGLYRPCIDEAAILTVVSSIPADNGATIFRPPYVGRAKTVYSTDNLLTDYLPSLTPTASTPTLATVEAYFAKPHLDEEKGGKGRALRPYSQMPDYGADIGQQENETALRLMINNTTGEKMQALINFVQYGIDIHAMTVLGQTWPRGGGEQPCHILPYAFAALLLNDSAMKTQLATLQANDTLYNDYVLRNKRADGTVLWGDDEYASEYNYWNNLANDSGSRTQRDPYNYIDGGHIPGSYYQLCCTSMVWKGMTLAFTLMPALKTVWNNENMWEYSERWVYRGEITQPDPCAPYDGTWSNYGITFGPDGSGGCILDTDSSDGIGRFPATDGVHADDGLRQTDFQNEMWDAYWETPGGTTYSLYPRITNGTGVITNGAGIITKCSHCVE